MGWIQQLSSLAYVHLGPMIPTIAFLVVSGPSIPFSSAEKLVQPNGILWALLDYLLIKKYYTIDCNKPA